MAGNIWGAKQGKEVSVCVSMCPYNSIFPINRLAVPTFHLLVLSGRVAAWLGSGGFAVHQLSNNPPIFDPTLHLHLRYTWDLRSWPFLSAVEWLDWFWWLSSQQISWSASSAPRRLTILVQFCWHLLSVFSSPGPFVLVGLQHFYFFMVILMGLWERVQTGA